MAKSRSFAEYVKEKCYSGLYSAADRYVDENWHQLDLYSGRVHRIGAVELTDATIQRVYVQDLPGMCVAFDVGLELELTVKEGDHHFDNYDQCYPWVRISCEGNLADGLSTWKIKHIGPYDKKSAPPNSLSDALVPYIPYDRLETEAKAFLQDYYPEALRLTPAGQPPVAVDPTVLAERLELSIRMQRIREDASVFGQIYFEDTDAEMYDAGKGETVLMHIPARSIVVDPYMYLLRNLGCVNNTIIHECVHWVKHHKVFVLEKLYNAAASNISCEVVGGAAAEVAKSATEMMEKQANQLTPRIQMPAAPFRAKAKEYIARFMRETGANHENEVMEKVITALERDFSVSRQAAKIRLVELGFDTAIGTYTYLDGHYVKPHGFRKGALKVNQTFSISAQDAAIERLVNPELRRLTETGDYLFIDNHYVYNAPLYVRPDADGRLDLTDYARSHMDECCLIFDMKITSQIREEYHTACYLNRLDSNVTFEVKFHNGFENAPQARQVEMRKKQQEEEMTIRKQMTDDPEQCMDLLLNWRKMNYTDLGCEIDRDPKTISRTVKGATKPTPETGALICFGLHLPPLISKKLLDVLGCPLNPMRNPSHQWINEALYLKYPEPVDVIREYLKLYGVEI